MNRFTALAVVILLWVGIYLPGLGTLELKGEEPRRSQPAVTMLETGNWLVPQLSGRPYLSKPPLVNWLIAGSMKLTGARNEFAARLPSVLAMLALAVALLLTGSRWLGVEGGFTAAVFMLANVGFVEKGRLAEIEAVYVALTGIAFAFWLAAWANRETGWRLWLIPSIALSLGLLAKGPTNLLLFYAVIVPVLFAAKEQRQLWSAGHLLSLLLAVAIFAAWAVPYHLATRGLNAEGVWLEQMKGRVGGGSTVLSHWLPNLPRALGNGLPWILFTPLWWNRRVLDAVGARNDRLRLLVESARWPLAIGFAALMLIPGMLPRYTLPLYPAMVLLLALVAPYALPQWRTAWLRTNQSLILLVLVLAVLGPWLAHPVRLHWTVALPVLLLLAFAKMGLREQSTEISSLAVWTAAAIAGGMTVFALDIMPRLRLREELRPVGVAIDQMVPAHSQVHLIEHGYEPALFYLRQPYVFDKSPRQFPAGTVYALLCKDDLATARKILKREIETVYIATKAKNQFFLLKVEDEKSKRQTPVTKRQSKE